MQTTNHKKYDVIIIGGGAAGLMCAATAAQRGRSSLVLEANEQVGKKILISGGGRCNFTNLYTQSDHYLSQNTHFCKSALSRYTPYHFIELLDKYGVAYHEKIDGQQFCNESAKDIVKILLNECERHGATIQTQSPVKKVSKWASGFKVETQVGVYECESLVIATGGLSFARLGANDFGFQIAHQFNLPIVTPSPALVPFTMDKQWRAQHEHLSGVSLPAKVQCENQAFIGDILFTHKGFSGPAILQISSYWQAGQRIVLDLIPHHALDDILEKAQKESPKALVKTVINHYLPKRLTDHLSDVLPDFHTTLANLSKEAIDHLSDNIHRFTFIPAGTEGYRKAEVTLGGVCTSALSSKTMAAKDVPNLFFIGEVVDVTGHLGGFNFQWAWASGYCAGQFA